MVFEELNETPVKGIYEVNPKAQASATKTPHKQAATAAAGKTAKKTQAPAKKHLHPSEEGKNVVAEKRPEYIGSLGEIDDEGCDIHDHVNTRFVLTEKLVEDVSSDRNKLAEYVVFAEILGKPKCKR